MIDFLLLIVLMTGTCGVRKELKPNKSEIKMFESDMKGCLHLF